MVAPAPGDLQIARRESFELKSTPLNELSRRFVIGLNVRLEPV
jgi:hypothetical protein